MEQLLSLSRLDVDDTEIRSLFDDIKVGYEQLSASRLMWHRPSAGATGVPLVVWL